MPRLNPFAWARTKLTKLWEAAIDGHVVALAWSDALGLIAAASADGPIALFDAKTGQLRANLPGHGFGTSCLSWSRNGLVLASGGQDGKIRLWGRHSCLPEPATGAAADTDPWGRHSCLPEPATGAAANTDPWGRHSCLPEPATGAAADKNVCPTDLWTKDAPAGAAWVERLAWCPIADLLASAAGKKLRLWNAAGELLREYPDHPSTIADIAWKPGATILASTAYGKLFLWSPEQAAAIQEFAWQGSMLALAWSPNGEYIAAGAQDCSVHFWLLKTGADLQMTGYPRKVRELSWDATSRYLATGGADVCCVWDCSGNGPANTEPIQLEAHKDFINCLAYQHKGELLASGGADGLAVLWRPSQQRGAISLAKHAGAVSQLAWSADDQRLAIGTAQGTVAVYAI